MCDMTHSYAWHDSFICYVTHFMCDVTHFMCDVTHSYVPEAHLWRTGWRRPIGCLELQVILRKRATNYRTLLRKMTWNDKASYGSSPHCNTFTCQQYTHKRSSEGCGRLVRFGRLVRWSSVVADMIIHIDGLKWPHWIKWDHSHWWLQTIHNDFTEWSENEDHSHRPSVCDMPHSSQKSH